MAFKFSRDFQTQVLGLMYQNFDFLTMASEIVEPDYFSDSILQWFFCTIRDHYQDYQKRIGEVALRNELLKACRAKPPRILAKDVKPYLEMFQKIQQPVYDKDYIVDEVATFCKHQAIKKAVIEAPKLLQEERFDEIETKISQAVLVGSNMMNIGEEYFMHWPERLRRRQVEEDEGIMPTGITILDRIIGGGLKPKQIGIWMAPTNRGKSVALVHCGKRALIAKRRVLHYTLELSSDAVSGRYDASFSHIPVLDLFDEEARLAKRLDKLGRKYGNSLIIKEYATKQAGVSTIRSHILQCVGMGFKPDLVLVDYLDLMKPSKNYREKRDELTATCEDLRGLAVDFDVPVWTATQAQRAAIALETHGEEHVAEDIGKVNTADIVLTINQTKKENEDGYLRLFIAKNRNGKKYRHIKFRTDLERMRFYVPPRVGTKPGEPEEDAEEVTVPVKT